ncbi:MAG: hypothetical protein WC462_02910 [archaeon]
MITNKKQVQYIIDLAQNEISNTSLPTVNLLIVFFMGVVTIIVSSSFIESITKQLSDQSVPLINKIILATGFVIPSLILIAIVLWAFWVVINRLSLNHDALSKLIQNGTRLKYKKKISIQEGADFYCQTKKAFSSNKRGFLGNKLDILSEIKDAKRE